MPPSDLAPFLPPAEGPLVSVVVPCYRQAHFLSEAIESALAQHHCRVEIVVVDDGSPDRPGDVVARYPGVRILHRPRTGVALARNAGAHASRGEYLVFLDADDRLRPDAVAQGIACLSASPGSGMAYGRWQWIAGDGTPLETPMLPHPTGDPYAALLERNYVGPPALTVWRRTTFERVGGFRDGFTGAEDYDLYLRAARCTGIHAHDAIVAEYRRHPDNASRDRSVALRGVLRALEAQRAYASQDPVYARALARGVRIARDYYGSELFDQMTSAVRARRWRTVVRQLGVLLRYDAANLVVTSIATMVAFAGISPP